MSVALPMMNTASGLAVPYHRHDQVSFDNQQEQSRVGIPTTIHQGNKYEKFAEWLCSRESLFRFGLDITGWVLPSLIGAATRNWYSFAEELFKTGLEFAGMGLATNFAKFGNLISGLIHLNQDERTNLSNYMLFHLNDMDDEKTMMQAAERLKKEEIEDIGFKQALGKDKNSEKYLPRINEIKNFFENFHANSDQLVRLRNFKKGVILIDSALEGIIWGGYFLYNRLFRKHILGQDRFTGTKAYANDEQSKKIGDSTPMNLLQKLGIGASILAAPVMNWGILKKLDNKEAVAKSPWLQLFKKQWDMTHGIYPKLGLMVSYLWLPVTMSGLVTAQGKSELIEQILVQGVMGSSWFFGHRLTNGVLAKLADNKLAAKHNVAPGILVEHDYLHHPTPEPAKIQHVLKQVQGKPELEKDARQAHASILYKGFALHSALVLAVRLLINMFTQWRVQKELKTK